MCNIGQYPLFCGHWARQLALKYINCGQSSLYKNHLTEKVEHYIGTGWCWSDKLWRVWHRVTEHRHKHSLKYPSDCVECGAWLCGSVVLMMMISAGEMWQQCGRFVHIRYSRHASPPLPLYSLIATSIKLGNPNAAGGEFSVTNTLLISRAQSVLYDWRLAEIYLLLLPRDYQEINVHHRVCSDQSLVKL